MDEKLKVEIIPAKPKLRDKEEDYLLMLKDIEKQVKDINKYHFRWGIH